MKSNNIVDDEEVGNINSENDFKSDDDSKKGIISIIIDGFRYKEGSVGSIESKLDDDSSYSNKKSSMITKIFDGLGLKDPEPFSIFTQKVDNLEQDSLLIAADLVISNPYKGTQEKYDELRELENKSLALQTGTHIELDVDINSPNIDNEDAKSSQVQTKDHQRTYSVSNIPYITELPPNLPPFIKNNSHRLGQNDAPISVEQQPTEPIVVANQKPFEICHENFVKNIDTQRASLNTEDVPGKQLNNVINDISSRQKDNTTAFNNSSIKGSTHGGFDGIGAKTYRIGLFYGDDKPVDFADVSLDMVYQDIKGLCTSIDRAYSLNDDSKYKVNKNTAKLFNNGRVDGTKDFIRLNFHINNFGYYDTSDVEDKYSVYKSTLFFRRHSIWLAMYTGSYAVRAIIMADKLYLFIPLKDTLGERGLDDEPLERPATAISHDSDELFVKDVVENMQKIITGWKDNNLSLDPSCRTVPFEYDVFRGLFTIIGSRLRVEYLQLKKTINKYLEYIATLKKKKKHVILSMGLEAYSQELKNSISKMITRLRSNSEALADIVHEADNADEYLKLMNITVLKAHPYLYSESDLPLRDKVFHEATENYKTSLVEQIIDKHCVDGEYIISKLNHLLELVQGEEEIFRLQLAFAQNRILLLNTVLTILACAIGFGSYLAGVFGMNLDNSEYLVTMKNSFAYVFGFSFLLIISTFLSAYLFFQKEGIIPRIIGKNDFNSFQQESTI